jgi:hypothetical protein
MTGYSEDTDKIFIGKSEGKKPFGMTTGREGVDYF